MNVYLVIFLLLFMFKIFGMSLQTQLGDLSNRLEFLSNFYNLNRKKFDQDEQERKRAKIEAEKDIPFSSWDDVMTALKDLENRPLNLLEHYEIDVYIPKIIKEFKAKNKTYIQLLSKKPVDKLTFNHLKPFVEEHINILENFIIFLADALSEKGVGPVKGLSYITLKKDIEKDIAQLKELISQNWIAVIEDKVKAEKLDYDKAIKQNNALNTPGGKSQNWDLYASWLIYVKMAYINQANMLLSEKNNDQALLDNVNDLLFQVRIFLKHLPSYLSHLSKTGHDIEVKYFTELTEKQDRLIQLKDKIEKELKKQAEKPEPGKQSTMDVQEIKKYIEDFNNIPQKNINLLTQPIHFLGKSELEQLATLQSFIDKLSTAIMGLNILADEAVRNNDTKLAVLLDDDLIAGLRGVFSSKFSTLTGSLLKPQDFENMFKNITNPDLSMVINNNRWRQETEIFNLILDSIVNKIKILVSAKAKQNMVDLAKEMTGDSKIQIFPATLDLLSPERLKTYNSSFTTPREILRVLGLDPAQKYTKAQIKKAFFARSKQLHPDRNKSPNAPVMFRYLQEANEKAQAYLIG